MPAFFRLALTPVTVKIQLPNFPIGPLAQKGRINLNQDLASLRKQLIDSGLVEVAVDGTVGISAAALVNFQGDPADRIITATAYLQGVVLLTAD